MSLPAKRPDGGIAMRRLLDFSRSAIAANGGT